MYGLIALGYSMVYGVLGFINFAHGEVFMVGAMTGFIAAEKFNANGMWESNFLLCLGLIVLMAIFFSTSLAVLMERVAYRPLRNSPRLIPLITSIGVSFFIQNLVLGLFGPSTKSYPRLPEWLSKQRSILTFEIAGTRLLVLVVAAASMGVLWYIVERTKTGKAMRAVAEDKEIASLMGIDVNRTIVTTFAVGGAMAGVGGILWGLMFRSVTHMTGFLPGVKAFTAAVVGGIGNLGGAMAGGISLGSAESIAPLLIQEQVVGTLHLESCRPRAFTADHVATATEVAASLAIAIQRAQLYRLSQQEIAELCIPPDADLGAAPESSHLFDRYA
jgi:branched-chain amino acid transport system permease protein